MHPEDAEADSSERKDETLFGQDLRAFEREVAVLMRRLYFVPGLVGC